jgi:hypothetical protein
MLMYSRSPVVPCCFLCVLIYMIPSTLVQRTYKDRSFYLNQKFPRRALRVRAAYPNRLDYAGVDSS